MNENEENELQEMFDKLSEALSLSQKEARRILIFIGNSEFLSERLSTELKENLWKVMANICLLEGMTGALKFQVEESCSMETLLTQIIFRDDTIYL